MSEILTPLTPEYTLIIPEGPGVLIGWVIGFVGIIILSLYLHDRSLRIDRQNILWLAVLSVLILILTPILGILPRMSPIMGLGQAPIQHLMFFAAIPWIVAGGVLGVLPATLLAGISGLLLAYLDTHNIFTPLVFMTIAIVFSWCVRQRFTGLAFKWLRFPVVAALISLFAATPIVLIVLALSAPGVTAARVAAAIARFPVVMFSLAGMVLVGGVAGMIVQALAQDHWGAKSPLRPSRVENHFKYRLLAFTIPIFMIVLGVVFISTWSIVRSSAQQLLLKHLTGTAGSAAEGLNVFLETGEILVYELAEDPKVANGSHEDAALVMNQNLQNWAYFEMMVLLDANGDLIAGVPENITGELSGGIDLTGPLEFPTAINTPRIYMGVDAVEENRTQINFIVRIRDQTGLPQRVLWAQTVLEENPYAHSFIKAMRELELAGGYGHIVDKNGEILFVSGDQGTVELFPGSALTSATYFQSKSADGRSLAHYYQPISGLEWGIAVTLPELPAQQVAWQTTYPVVLIVAGVMVLILSGVWVGLSPIAKEMDMMAGAINAVAMGNYDLEQLQARTKSQSGKFSKAILKLLTSQKIRMDKQAALLSVSSKVAGQLNSKDSLHIILAAALTQSAACARMVLTDSAASASPEDADHRLGMGQHARVFSALDLPVFELSRKAGQTVLRGTEITKQLPFSIEMPNLASVVILPLKWKDLGLGVFWVAYLTGPAPTGEEINDLKELTQMASMAIVNAKTYEDSQSSLGLMESIFDLLPEAVLITDQHGNVLFQNKGAAEKLGLKQGLLEGKSLSTVFRTEDFAQIDKEMRSRANTKEIRFTDGKVYQLVSSPVRINPRQVGTVLILKNITQQVQDESLKSEFVTTVSHELRSPLTLILGYAKILRLTGNLNEQQDAYISNIIESVEEMKNLVQKLLDIGRLEGGDSLNFQQFTAGEIIHRVVESMDAHAKQKNIQISVNLPAVPLLIEADQTFITQALRNLLENAVKFSKMEGEVTLSARHKDERVVFAVQDKGIGIAPLDQRNLFKKFSRTNALTGNEAEGSGLGLAIVKSIAERHGGRVWLESQLGKGSTFYFEIPCKQP